MKILKGLRLISEGKFLNKYILDYEVDGKSLPYEVCSRNKLKDIINIATKANAVEIIAKFEDGDILVCKEFRYPLNDFCYEFPAGLIDEGETPEEAATRELMEETGLEVISIDKVLPMAFSSAGMSDEAIITVYMTVKGEFKGSDNPKEEIYSYKMSKKDIKELIERNDVKISHRCQLVLNSIV